MDVSSTPPKYTNEKIEYDIQSIDEQVKVETDPSTRELQVEEYQFTWRAAIVGSLLGCLVGKQNHL
jgi:hypothetical protein